MAILFEHEKLAYFPVPKAAHTSLKLALYKMAFGHVSERGEIHTLWPPRSRGEANVPEGYFKFAVVRDPVARFVSAFQQIFRKLPPRHIRRSSLPLPDIKDVIENLDAWRAKHRPLKVHTDSQQSYICDDLMKLDYVCRIEDLAQLSDAIAKATGVTLTIPHANRNRDARQPKPQLDDDDVRRLVSFYADDYKLLAAFYQAP